jgi:AraC family transcriptional regulator
VKYPPPRIELITEKLLIGMSVNMSLALSNVSELWRGFITRIPEIQNRVSSEMISMANYPIDYFEDFNPGNEFEKWAAVEVTDLTSIPYGMRSFVIPSGHYAIFDFKGSSSDPSIFQYIHSTWLPSSEYKLDHRPHFEILGDKYKNNGPSSEEEILIPIISN